jgi:dolichol-phosphate mannosyltransferase
MDRSAGFADVPPNTGRNLLIFVATYNEAENVEGLFERIQRLNLDADILFLDDNSPDGTGAIIDRIAAHNPGVHAIHRAGKLGIGSAHSAGIAWAYEHGYRTLVTMDCDFTHSPERIVDFLAHSGTNDIVVGSRYLQKGSLRSWNLLRKILTHTGHWLTRGLLRMPYDATGAFRLYRLDRIPAGVFNLVYSRSYSFFFESLYICWLNGARIHEISIELPARTYGNSKMAWRDAMYSTILLLHLFLKTRIDSRSLLHADPFSDPAAREQTQAQREWDAYWLQKKKPGALVYDLIAAFYRKFIIKPGLNHFARKYFSPGARILHAGCGGGQVDSDIAHRLSISALDISEQALSMYRKCQPLSERLIHGSIFEIPAGDSTFDGIYNLGVMEHFTEPEIHRILTEFHRVLKPGGKIVLFWPPSFGLTVRVLAAVHWVLHKAGKHEIKLHPDEITHVRSRKQVRAYLQSTGFSFLHLHFGCRDLFTQAVVVGRKEFAAAPASSTHDGVDTWVARDIPMTLETVVRS